MEKLLLGTVFVFYAVATVGLLVYGLNCYVMLALFLRKRKAANNARRLILEKYGDILKNSNLPVVTTQIAIYNEYNVAERSIRAACAMHYAPGKHEIQVLDDSTDSTAALVGQVVAELQAKGHDVKVLHRENRLGFKAGALQEGLEKARGELVSVFDADFVPPEDFLTSLVPFFLDDAALGFAQTRWGHLNRRSSMLTRAQSIGIDGHFVIEQVARSWNNLYMNFNGTAGMWRRQAIESAGGWQWDTLTEDLDLSYRVQFAGWKNLYIPDVIVPAELPEDVNAFRVQQFRWAKGSFQTLIKLFPRIWSEQGSIFKKVQAVLHISGYFVHPLMLTLALLAVPVLHMNNHIPPLHWLYLIMALPLGLSIIAPTTMYLVSQGVTYKDWRRRVALLPFLIIVGVGLALSNTRAIVEAFIGRETPFVRTPKRGNKELVRYKVRLPWVAALEIAIGIYSTWSIVYYSAAGKFAVVPFLGIYAAGFLFIGLLTVAHSIHSLKT